MSISTISACPLESFGTSIAVTFVKGGENGRQQNPQTRTWHFSAALMRLNDSYKKESCAPSPTTQPKLSSVKRMANPSSACARSSPRQNNGFTISVRGRYARPTLLRSQVHFESGVANGLLVVRTIPDCAKLLRSVLIHSMEFKLKLQDILSRTQRKVSRGQRR